MTINLNIYFLKWFVEDAEIKKFSPHAEIV